MNTMRPTASMVSTAGPSLLAAVVVSIVLGIVGMHALDTRGVARDTDHSDRPGHLNGNALGTHGDLSVGASAGDASEGDGHGLGSMVMLCFAMLAVTAGALVLLLLGLRRGPRVWPHRLAAPPSVTRWVFAHLGTGPPYVWHFSVIRC